MVAEKSKNISKSKLPEEKDHNLLPFSIINNKLFKDNCKIMTFKPGSFIINEEEIPKGIYILSKGMIGVGNVHKSRNKTFWIERTTVMPGSVIGEMEISLKLNIGGNDFPFESTSPSQRAWPSSERLKWYAAYQDDEKKIFADEVEVLLVPNDCLNNFLSVPEFKEWLLFDHFRKARQYYLDCDSVKLSTKANFRYKYDDIVYKTLAFYNQRCAIGADIKRKVYIFGIARYEALIKSHNLVGKEIDDINQRAMELNLFNIQEINSEQFRNDLPEDKKAMFFVKKSNEPFPLGSENKIKITSNDRIFCISDILFL